MKNDQRYYLAKKLLQKGYGSERIKKLYESMSGDFVQIDAGFVKTFKKEHISLLPFWEKEYPARLKNIKGYPAILFGKGNMKLLQYPSITIVGTRDIGSYGMKVIDFILKHLHKDITVISGLATGVDAYVHIKSLEQGRYTISIVAGGIDKGYPKSNQGIYNRISKEGLILAEFPLGKTIIKGMFPMRNRIMAGLSLITLVIEAGERSGSFITASHALEYGNEVYAVPGNIFSKVSLGCNRLIQMGATPLINKEDVNIISEYIFDKFKL